MHCALLCDASRLYINYFYIFNNIFITHITYNINMVKVKVKKG
jgi:hypothetical protein